MNKFKIYFKSILIPVLVGAIVGLLISSSMDYNELQKPMLAPPGKVFPVVWTILYVLMGISYGILKSDNLISKDINSIYYVQLFFNALWPIAFFIFKWRLFAFVWIICLALLVADMIYKFYEKNKVAGLLQLPYLIWTVFASYLNISIYLLNR